MKIIVTGTNGFVGSRIARKLRENGHVVYSLTRDVTDIADFSSVRKFFDGIRPEAVVHAAAVADMRTCDTDRDMAARTNITGTQSIASACALLGARLVYISTDQVYNYFGNTPLYEYTTPAPTNFYGITKLEGERAAALTVPMHHILRLSWQFGAPEEGLPYRGGIYESAANALKGNAPIKVAKDGLRHLTWVHDTVDVAVAATEIRLPFGIYNVASKNTMTDLEAFQYALKKLGATDTQATQLVVEDENMTTRRLTAEPYNLQLAGYKLPSFTEGFERCIKAASL